MQFIARRKFLQGIASFSFVTLSAQFSFAGVGCKKCGCTDNCRTVCYLKCEEKKVTSTCWKSEAEDFCVPGPSKPGCKHVVDVCAEDEDGECQDHHHGQQKKLVWTDWIPGCASVHTKHKLMKKTVKTTIPSHKWVTETLCEKCTAQLDASQVKENPGPAPKSQP